MTLAVSLDDLIEGVERVGPATDPLSLLRSALTTATSLEETADALVDHYVDQCRRSGHSWTEISEALGVSKQAAHRKFTLPVPAEARYSGNARAALADAAEEAAQLGHNYIGTEHVLLGLLEPAVGVAAGLLASTHMTRPAVRVLVTQRTPRSPLRPGTPSARPFTPRASRCLDRASIEANSDDDKSIETEHLLLALLFEQPSLAAEILEDFGIDYQQIRERVTRM